MNQQKDKKEMILDVATRIFAKYGYNKTSLDEIAQEANIAKGTIYYYFNSKEELFLKVVQAQFGAFIQAMDKELQKLSGFEAKLRYFLQGPMIYACEHMSVWIQALKNIPFNFENHFEEFRSSHRDYMLNILHEIMEEGYQEGMISENIDPQKLSVMINDWFLLGNLSVRVSSMDELLKRIERDQEIIAQILLYVLLKRC